MNAKKILIPVAVIVLAALVLFAASAGLAVGYESPTQFNREYKRLFGEPPQGGSLILPRRQFWQTLNLEEKHND